MKNQISIFIILVCFKSYSQTSVEKKLRAKIDTVVYRNTECENCPVFFDTIIFTKVKCGLYINSMKDIAYQSQMIINDRGKRGIRYISWIYGIEKEDSVNGGLKEMKYVIDIKTFKFYSYAYWGDKNRVYEFTPMSDGGTVRYVENADPKTFNVFGETPYGSDKNHVYYKGEILEGADIRTFKIIMNKGIPELAKDKHTYYFSGDRISKEQLKDLRKE